MMMMMIIIIIIIIIIVIIIIILWNQQVQTGRTIPNNNKSDNTIRDNKKGTCMLIDVTISGERNV
jgi:preprotein translocase subunit SecG